MRSPHFRRRGRGSAWWRGGREHERDHIWALSDKKRGFKPGMNPIRLNHVWREWAFRANFMYKLVV